MDFRLDGKVALVTGGNSGIGRAIALAYAAQGARVAIASRNKERNASVAGELGPSGRSYAVDVGDAEAVRALIGSVAADFGSLDVLVNNAGMAAGGPISQLDLAAWRRVMDVNFTSALVASSELAKLGTPGKIINILSEYATFGAAFIASYAASKHALHGLTKSLAIELAPRVQVNGIQPGWIDTRMTKGAQAVAAMNAEILQRTPMQRWGVPGDCSGAAVFLASPAADFITGAVITVDGGYRIR